MKNASVAAMIIAFATNSLSAQDAGWDRVTETQGEAVRCVVGNSVRLDDGQTSPEVIARAGFRACKNEVEAFVGAFRSKAYEMIPTDPRGTRDADVGRQLEPILRDIQDLSIQAILENRAAND